jgi:DMSO/TMAO reductase YedYZ molybdopterin-dependent catalytic subunit
MVDGADCGEFGGIVVDAYVKDLPIARIAEDVLIAYEMNGSELPVENGFLVFQTE